jgi:hypothetical protein
MRKPLSRLFIPAILWAACHVPGFALDGKEVCSRCDSVWQAFYLSLGSKVANYYNSNGGFEYEVASCLLKAEIAEQEAYFAALDSACYKVQQGNGGSSTNPPPYRGIPVKTIPYQ